MCTLKNILCVILTSNKQARQEQHEAHQLAAPTAIAATVTTTTTTSLQPLNLQRRPYIGLPRLAAPLADLVAAIIAHWDHQ